MSVMLKVCFGRNLHGLQDISAQGQDPDQEAAEGEHT